MKRIESRRIGRPIGILIFVALVVGVAAIWLGERWSSQAAFGTARRAAVSRTIAAGGLLSSELQKYRLLPLVLADYPEVQAALDTPSPAATARLNARLELLSERTDAAALYLVAANGMTIAASNWRLPTTFVGQRYGFRPYFSEALRRGAAEQFALGTISKRPGLFLARRTAQGNGVIVVKVEFDRLERNWSHQAGPTIVRDENGVVIMTSRPAWRLRASRPLPPAIAAQVRRSLQYGETAPPPLAPAVALPASDDAPAVLAGTQRYATATFPIPVSGWTVTALEPLAPALAAARAEVRAGILVAMLVLVVLAGLVVRARERRLLGERAQRELEDQVDRRTTELRDANARLRTESTERARNEARLRVAREELAQSNRLATLGQITAGVAHEINQPLSAIRTFAENTLVLIERRTIAEAHANLVRIVELTRRIGDITGELRLFARRDRRPGPVRIDEAIDGALLLMGDRLRGSTIEIVRSGDHDPALTVAADRVRVEQILINLLQNAADALAGVAGPRIAIRVTGSPSGVDIAVSDNGPGVSPAFTDRLFTPFSTEKADGLGLGLVISRDLARQVGGDLIHRGGDGATFVLRLVTA